MRMAVQCSCARRATHSLPMCVLSFPFYFSFIPTFVRHSRSPHRCSMRSWRANFLSFFSSNSPPISAQYWYRRPPLLSVNICTPSPALLYTTAHASSSSSKKQAKSRPTARSPSPPSSRVQGSQSKPSKARRAAAVDSPTKRSVKAMGRRYYAVANGRSTGIFDSWDDCSAQVTGYSGAVFKSFSSQQEAEAYVDSRRSAPSPSYTPSRSYTPSTSYAAAPRARARSDSPESVEDYAPVRQARRVSAAAVPYASPPTTTHSSVRWIPPAHTVAATDRSRRPHSHHSEESHRSHHRSAVQEVYVDGACSQNGQRGATGGYGGFYGDNDSRNFSLPLPDHEPQTNNRGEMRAVLHALEGQLRATAPLTPLRIHTDSRYVLDGLTKYSKKWKTNGFRLSTNEPVKNQDLWETLIDTRDKYNTRYAQEAGTPKQFTVMNTQNDGTEAVELRHVRGHSKIHGNERADELAVLGAKRHRSA